MRKRLLPWCALGLLLALGCVLRPAPVAAQISGFGPGIFSESFGKPGRSAVGFGLWYGESTLRFDAAGAGASNEVRGYTDTLPGSLRSRGPAFGISFGNWGLNIGFNEGQADLGRNADVLQTPGDNTDDNYVISLRRTSRTVTLVVNPLRWLFLGYGQEDGSMEFFQVLPGGTGSTRKLPFSYGFYSVGLAAGFDPRKGDVGPLFTVYAKIPAERGDFSATEFGAGIGLYL